MKYAIVNLGCKVNRVESDDLALSLERLGMQPVGRDAKAESGTLREAGEGRCNADLADFVVVNTCTVTGEAEKKTRKAVRRALREHPGAVVVVTGCAAAIDAAVFESMDERVVVVGKREIAEASQSGEALGLLIPALARDLRSRPLLCGEPADAALEELRVGEGFPTRVGIKVQDGCNNACTYCIVHVARGRAWSRPADEVVREFARYASSGVNEVVLSGINLGTYRDGSTDLAKLLMRLLDASETTRIRISSIEPKDVGDRLIELIAQSGGRIARHLHLPLQSGSTRVLRGMARPYSAKWYCDLVDRLYQAVPELSLSTDIIVGFPGETEADFEETTRVSQACRFSKIHVFPYSKRAGTPAAERLDQVEPEVKATRSALLSELGARLREEAYAKRRGTTEKVLVEACGKGMTESYFEISVSDEYAVGDLVSLILP